VLPWVFALDEQSDSLLVSLSACLSVSWWALEWVYTWALLLELVLAQLGSPSD
jgi:hypothetical protein